MCSETFKIKIITPEIMMYSEIRNICYTLYINKKEKRISMTSFCTSNLYMVFILSEYMNLRCFFKPQRHNCTQCYLK